MSPIKSIWLAAKAIATVIVIAIAMSFMTTTSVEAQRGPAAAGASTRAAPAVTPAPAAVTSPKVQFNRANFGPQSGVNPGLTKRAYRAYEALQSPGGARGAGLRAAPYRNDALKGETPLPKTTPTGAPISYQRINLRPGGHERSHSNARAVVGSDKSVWVSRHYGQDGGQVKRVQ